MRGGQLSNVQTTQALAQFVRAVEEVVSHGQRKEILGS